MDSSQTRSPIRPDSILEADTPVATADDAQAVADVPPGTLARLGRLLPGVDALVRFAYRVAVGSAISAGLVVAALSDAFASLSPGVLSLVGLVLCLPAGAIALAGWTLADLASLPRQLKDAALAATGRADAARSVTKGSRIGRLLRSLWAARGLALLTKGGWMKAVGALRFVRLASLPFALALLGAVALNGVVIAAGVVSLFVLIF